MVGRLVEHQHVVAGQQHLGQRHPATLATREPPTSAVEIDTGQQMRDDRAGVGFGRPDVVGPAADDHLAHGGAGREVVGLPQVADREAGGVGDPAGIGLPGAGQHLQKRRLAVAVAPDDADRVASSTPRLTASSSVRVP